MFYLSNVAIVVNMSQPSVRIGGGLHALIHIYFLHGGLKAPNRIGTLDGARRLRAGISAAAPSLWRRRSRAQSRTTRRGSPCSTPAQGRTPWRGSPCNTPMATRGAALLLALLASAAAQATTRHDPHGRDGVAHGPELCRSALWVHQRLERERGDGHGRALRAAGGLQCHGL